jgi:hypothetical protein
MFGCTVPKDEVEEQPATETPVEEEQTTTSEE